MLHETVLIFLLFHHDVHPSWLFVAAVVHAVRHAQLYMLSVVRSAAIW